MHMKLVFPDASIIKCKKRKDELRDKKLFEQRGSSYLGECPICFLPMPLDPAKSIFYSCCSELICIGCDHANDMNNGGDRCPFCREPTPNGNEEMVRRALKRVKANDPTALRQMGGRRYREGDYDEAVEYLAKAADLGYADAPCRVGDRVGGGGYSFELTRQRKARCAYLCV